jgi:uncharacterized cupredoxin-like copper-binding protein
MFKQLLIPIAIAFALLGCGTFAAANTQPPARAHSTPQPAEIPASGNIVTVIEDEFHVTFEPAQPVTGEITFVVKNQGHIPHNFRISGNGVEQHTMLVMPGQSGTLTAQLKPGTYDYECAVEGHAAAGMRGRLTVGASSSN